VNILFGVRFLDGMIPFSVRFSCNLGFISPVHAVLFTFCLCIVIIQYHVKFVSVKKLYDTIYKPCLNNYTQNVFVFIVSVNMCKVRCMMPWLYDPFCHYRKQTNVPQPKTDEHIFMVEEHKLCSPANIS
jgi:hypothetical protein